ncbi:haloacid dehalogenase-like hydrolase family protein [Cryptosporidium felis]|nr:haloacid dehalogenase-like hydrolase family protein [Cryptosporidium felis]
MSSSIACVFTDVDGTLADSKNQLSVRNARTMAALMDSHIVLVPATGRSKVGFLRMFTEDIMDIAKHHGFPGIFFNGAVLIGPNGPDDVVKTWTIPDDCMIELCNLLDSIKVEWQPDDEGFEEAKLRGETHRSVAYSVYLLNEFVHSVRGSHLRHVEGFSREFSVRVNSVVDVIKNNPNQSLKFIIGETRETLEEIKDKVQEFLKGKPARVLFSHPLILEILHIDCSKGHAAEHLLRTLKINPSNCLAIGDAENDVELLRLSGVSVAVGNACQEAKDAAQYLVSSNDDDGFSEAIQRFCNIQINVE